MTHASHPSTQVTNVFGSGPAYLLKSLLISKKRPSMTVPSVGFNMWSTEGVLLSIIKKCLIMHCSSSMRETRVTESPPSILSMLIDWIGIVNICIAIAVVRVRPCVNSSLQPSVLPCNTRKGVRLIFTMVTYLCAPNSRIFTVPLVHVPTRLPMFGVSLSCRVYTCVYLRRLRAFGDISQNSSLGKT